MSTSKLPRITSTKRVSLPASRLINKKKEQNEYFTKNGFIIVGLLPFLPRDERELVQPWIEKLQTLNKTDEERQIRNDYTWFLLVQLENGKMTLPFIEPPPNGILKPVQGSINKALYEDILQAANKRASYIQEPEMTKQPINSEDKTLDEELIRKIKPEEFLERQPIPRYGFIVYGSCFSNQNAT